MDVDFNEGLREIGEDAFVCCPSLEEIELPASVTMIGRSAFQCCKSLLYARLECAAKHIRPFTTFSHCTALKEVVLPEELEFIGCAAFCGCSALEDAGIPETLRKFDWVEKKEDGNTLSGVFEGCASLKEIYIPDGVEIICDDIFKGCSALREVSVPGSVRPSVRWRFSAVRAFVASSCTRVWNQSSEEPSRTVPPYAP